ncbi:MAG: CotH kinase family protein [Prevotella sp.]|nr:CotH kinase family protein [Prevotella sp.]
MKKLLRMAFMALSLLVCTGAWADHKYRDISDFNSYHSEIKTKIDNGQQITPGIPTMYITVTNYTKNTGEIVNGISIDKTTSMPNPLVNDAQLNNYLFKRQGSTGDDDFAPYMNATIKVIDDSQTNNISFEDETTIKARGNMTCSLYKRPYRLKFGKDEKDEAGNVIKSHKHDLINGDNTSGNKKVRNWVLLSNDNDRSLIRNAVTYHLGKYLGLAFCPRYRFVELVINGSYRGIYQITDQIEQGSSRVPIDENTGWLLELNSNQKQLETPYVVPQNNTGANIKNPDTEDYTEVQTSELINDVKTYLDNLKAAYDNYGAYTNPNTGYRAYVDIEDLINFYIALELTGDFDGLMSVYAYKDNEEGKDQKLHFGPLWDKDIAYGNYGNNSGKVCDVNNQGQISGWFKVLWNDPELINQMKERFDEVKVGLKAELSSAITNLSTLLTTAKDYNFDKWGISGQQMGSWTTIGNLSSYDAYIEELQSWLLTGSNNRFLWMENEINSAVASANKNKTTYTYDVKEYLNNDNLYNYRNKYADVTVTNRTFYADKWNSVCFPFSISATQLTNVFGNGYELKEFSGVSSDGTMQFTTPADNAIISERPYLLRFTGSDLTTLTFNDVVISGKPSNNPLNNGYTVSYDESKSFVGNIFQYSVGTDVYLIDGDGNVVRNTSDNLIGSNAYIVSTTGTDVKINLGEVVIENLEFDVNNGSTLAEKVGGTYNIQLKNRGLLYADGWCTICLPFTITKKNFEAAIGDYETKLRELASIQGSSFNFDKLADTNKTMEAGVPYLIMIDTPSAPETTVSLDGITFENTKLEATTGTSISPKEGYAFVGILEAKQLAKNGTELFMGANSELYKPSSTSGKLGGGRAYFKIPSKANTSGAKISVTIDGIVTSIEEQIKNAVEPKDSRVFNLNGQKINSSNLLSLPRGIYIINGKKVMK